MNLTEYFTGYADGLKVAPSPSTTPHRDYRRGYQAGIWFALRLQRAIHG